MKYFKEVLWMPHRFCSHGCVYCCSKGLRDNEDIKKIERNVQKGIEYIRRFCLNYPSLVTLDGGEVSETPSFINLCKELAPYKLAIYTNLHEEVWHDFVNQIPIDRVDHVFATNHRTQTFDRFYEHLKLLKERGFKVVANIVTAPDRIKDILWMDERLKELDVTLLCGHYFENGVLKNTDVAQYMRFDGDIKRLDGNGFVNTKGKVCQSGCNAIIITDSGDIRICAHIGKVLGNIHRELPTFPQTPQVCENSWCSCFPYLIRGYIEGMDEVEKFDKVVSKYYPQGTLP
jgi:MoaA/NifB/PqqE/SkfB family radical SAM enzyme